MKTINLKIPGATFGSDFKTVITKIIDPDKDTRVVLDALPRMELSLGEETGTSLGLSLNQEVTIRPVKDSSDGSFLMDIGSVVKNPRLTHGSTRGSSPLPGMTLSNKI